MIRQLLGYLAGTVQFEAVGGRVEWLLNQCAQAGIPLRGVRPVPGGVRAWAPARRYRRIHPLVRRSHSRVHIVKKRGLCFTAWRYRGRWGLLLGPAAMLLVIMAAGNLVWAVRFDGLPLTEQLALRSLLYEQGIYEGAWMDSSRLDNVRQGILSEGSNYSWLTLNFYRGRLVVEANTQDKAPEITAFVCSDLVAAADGVILGLNIQSGNVQCAQGQTVAKGQLLVAGQYVDRDNRVQALRSMGNVMAQVECTYRCTQPLQLNRVLPTGELDTGRRILALGSAVSLGSQPQPGEMDEVKVTRKPFTIFGFGLPATLEETTVTRCAARSITLSESQAADLARLACQQRLYADFPGAVITAQSEQQLSEEDGVTMEIRFIIQADIAREEPRADAVG